MLDVSLVHTHDIYINKGDTVLHSWEVLANILSSDKTLGILCDIGMYVTFVSPSQMTDRLWWVQIQASNAQECDIQLSRDCA
jgi:hypothetical protein